MKIVDSSVSDTLSFLHLQMLLSASADFMIIFFNIQFTFSVQSVDIIRNR